MALLSKCLLYFGIFQLCCIFAIQYRNIIIILLIMVKRNLSVPVLIFAIGCLASCISRDNDLDFSREISMDIRLASDGFISFPLGDMGRVRLDSLMVIDKSDPDAVVKILSDSIYGIEKSGVFDDAKVSVAPLDITFVNPQFERKSLEFDSLSVPDVIVKGACAFKTSIGQSAVFNIDNTIDESVIEVRELGFGTASELEIGLLFEGIPESVSVLEIDNLDFVFPEDLVLSLVGNDSRLSLNGNTLSINGLVTRAELAEKGGQFTIDGLRVSALHFENPLRSASTDAGNSIAWKGNVSYSGNVTASGYNVRLSDFNGASISISASLTPTRAAYFIGKVFPSISEINKEFQMRLNEDLSFLTSKENRFSLRQVEIAVNLNSDVTVPLMVSFSMDSKDSDGNIIAQDVTPDDGAFRIPAASVGETRQTKVYVRNNLVTGPSDRNTIQVRASRLPDLISTVPDKLSISLNAVADTSATGADGLHYVEFGKTMTVSGGYELSAPLTFDDLRLSYTRTEDAGDDFRDIRDEVISAVVEFSADIINTIPVDLNMTMVPLDIDGKDLSSVISFSDIRIAAGSPGNPKKQKVTIKANTANGNLSAMENIQLRIIGEGGNGTSLRSNGYIEIKNALLRLGDVNLDLSDK